MAAGNARDEAGRLSLTDLPNGASSSAEEKRRPAFVDYGEASKSPHPKAVCLLEIALSKRHSCLSLKIRVETIIRSRGLFCPLRLFSQVSASVETIKTRMRL